MFTRIFRRVCLFGPTSGVFSSAAASSVPETRKASHILLLAIPITTFGLGTWQVYRLQWKKDLIKQLEHRTSEPPVSLPANYENLQDLEYRRIAVKGEFDHSKEVILGPRSLMEGSINTSRPQTTSGYHIITPFKLDNGDRILVNRGWVDRKKRDPDTRKEGQIQGPVQVVGFLRKGEKRRTFVPRNEPHKNQWHFCEVDAMARYLDTLPVMIDADAGSTVPEGPIGGQTRVTLRNEHLQYIITWYSLTAATAYMYYKFRKAPAAVLGSKAKPR